MRLHAEKNFLISFLSNEIHIDKFENKSVKNTSPKKKLAFSILRTCSAGATFDWLKFHLPVTLLSWLEHSQTLTRHGQNTVKINIYTHVKISQVLASLWQAVNKLCSHWSSQAASKFETNCVKLQQACKKHCAVIIIIHVTLQSTSQVCFQCS